MCGDGDWWSWAEGLVGLSGDVDVLVCPEGILGFGSSGELNLRVKCLT